MGSVNQCVDSTPLHLCTLDCLLLDLSCAFDHTFNAFALAQACHENRVALDTLSLSLSSWGWQGRAESEKGLSSPVPDQ